MDNLLGNILCICVKEFFVLLVRLFNLFFRIGKMFILWKLVNIILIYKEDNREFVINYKFIFLLLILVKCLERIVCFVINDYILLFLIEW